MCIIVAKKAGVEMPGLDTLWNCWKSNPHGAGVMWADGEVVHIRKGLMTWDDFEDEIEKLECQYDMKKLPLVLHFRISTQAGVNPQNTHPFPISKRTADLTALRFESENGALVHNGIIPCCSSYDEKDKYSDTFYFVKRYVSQLIGVKKWMRSEKVLGYLEKVAKSKLAIMDKSGYIGTVGKFEADEGVLYSNDTYLPMACGYRAYHSGWGKNSYYGSGVYDDKAYGAEDGVVSYSWNEVTVFPCTDEMFYFDEYSGACDDCAEGIHWYDANGLLYEYDIEKDTVHRVGTARVYDGNFKNVKPDYTKLQVFTRGYLRMQSRYEALPVASAT